MKKYLFFLVLSGFFAACSSLGTAPDPVDPVPSPEQVSWQQDEIWAFVHFGPNTFTDSEWGYGDADPSVFHPSRLDCEQWARTFVQSGIRGVIITAKHHDGFCLWPSRYTDYSVAASPYKGDVVGELAAACKKYGLKFGVYLSPWDRHQASYGTPEYVEYYKNQLRELLTDYAPVSEVWLDGANGGDGWYGGASERRTIDRRTYYDFPAIHQIVNELAPGALIFSDGGPGCRWVGNERGIASDTNWSFLRGGEVYPGYPAYQELGPGHEDGDAWIPAECDVSIRPGWFYHSEEDGKVKSARELADLYYQSVGRNGKLLLNFPVDRTGRIHPLDSAAAVDAHKILVSELAAKHRVRAKAAATETRGWSFSVRNVIDNKYDTYWSPPDGVTMPSMAIAFPKKVEIDRLLLQEYIPLGQRVRAFSVEYLDGKEFKPLPAYEQTTTIGYKRILRFQPIKTRALVIKFTDCRDVPCISTVHAFLAP